MSCNVFCRLLREDFVNLVVKIDNFFLKIVELLWYEYRENVILVIWVLLIVCIKRFLGKWCYRKLKIVGSKSLFKEDFCFK